MIEILKAYEVKKEKDHPLVECSTFADDILYEHMTRDAQYQKLWHFVNRPYFNNGTLDDYKKYMVPD